MSYLDESSSIGYQGDPQDQIQNNPEISRFEEHQPSQHYENLSCKSQQSQSFMMDNSVLNLHHNEEELNNHTPSTTQGDNKNNNNNNILSSDLNNLNNNNNILSNPNVEIRIGYFSQEKEGRTPQKNRSSSSKQRNNSDNPSANKNLSSKSPEKLQPIYQPQQDNPNKLNIDLKLSNRSLNSKNITSNNPVTAWKYIDTSSNNGNNNSKNITIHEEIKIELQDTTAENISSSNRNTSNNHIKQRKHILGTIFRKVKIFSSVSLLCFVMVLMFIIQLIIESANNKPRPCVEYDIGGMFAPAVANQIHLHRLIISSFLHGSWMHICSTQFTLLFYGYVLERNYGVIKMVGLYCISSITGNLFAGLINPYHISVGPSSIVMAVLTLQVLFLYQIWERIPKHKKKPILAMVVMLFITNVLCALESTTVKYSNFLGGFIAGVLVAAIYYQPKKGSQNVIIMKIKRISPVLLGIIVLSCFIALMARNTQDINISNLEKCHST